MDQRQYMLNALNQIHPESSEEFLKYVENIFGQGELLDIHKYMCEKYGLPKIGTGRVAYISKKVVFKVPIDIDGFRLNDWEASLVSLHAGTPYEIPLAKSRHFFGSQDIPIVVMEKVKEMSLSEIKEMFGEIPSFVSAVDMGQVGLNSRGKLVAFDYADL
jgi:hypothetical protein